MDFKKRLSPKRLDNNLEIGNKKINQEIISFSHYNNTGRRVFWVRCNFCKNEYQSTIENFRDCRRSGLSCKNCQNAQFRTYETLSAQDNQVSIVYSNYKSRAKSKGWDFELDKIQFKNIVKSNCYYCDIVPNKFRPDRIKGKRSMDAAFLLNGIDRIDSAKGYVLDNVVPCCEDCNKAKRNLSTDQFINMIKMIYHHYVVKNA